MKILKVRLFLEKRGSILLKDSTANKGGVTSSFLEVLSALALSDEQYDMNMRINESANNPPLFYQQYVKEAQGIIAKNATNEFDCLWRERELSGKPLSTLSDLLSLKIDECKKSLSLSNIWDDLDLRESVITDGKLY